MCLLWAWHALKENDKYCSTGSLKKVMLQASNKWSLKYLKVLQSFNNLNARARWLTSTENKSCSQTVRSGLRQSNFSGIFFFLTPEKYWLFFLFHLLWTRKCISWFICWHPFRGALHSPCSLMFCCCSVLPAHQVLLPEQITHLMTIKVICESFAFCDFFFFLLQLETFIFFQFFRVFVPDTAPLTTSLINALASPCTIAGGF